MVDFPMNVLVDLTTIRHLDWEYVVGLPLNQWNPLIFINFGVLILSGVLSMLVTTAVIVTTQRALKHQTTGPLEALGLAAGFWPKLVATSALVAVCVVGGFLAFFIPAMIFAFLFFFSSYTVILGKHWGFRALFHSAQLVLKHPGVVFTRVLGAGVLVGLPAFAVLASSGQIDVYGIPAVGETLVDVMVMFFVVVSSMLFLELEQHLLEG